MQEYAEKSSAFEELLEGNNNKLCLNLPNMTSVIEHEMCSSRKYPYSPHRRDWKFLGGGGFSKAQKLKSMYEAFKTGISREVGESKEKSLPWGRYG